MHGPLLFEAAAEIRGRILPRAGPRNADHLITPGSDSLPGEACSQFSHGVFLGHVVAVTHPTGPDTRLYGARRFRQLREIVEARGAPKDYL